jgi:phytoene synthase
MKYLFDNLSHTCSKEVTREYSTSFFKSVNLLSPRIQPAIHNIYGFVRLADEIVDSFLEWDRKHLLDKFEEDLFEAISYGISLNPILNAFQKTVNEYNIDLDLISAFLNSMRMDLEKSNYTTFDEYDEYIYGSADAVGLMCLKVFVNGDEVKYNNLKPYAMKLGSAFQKVNFLRDLKDDTEILNRSYFPHVDFGNLSKLKKEEIINEIESDFQVALKGIRLLPSSSRYGVYTAYICYKRLLDNLKKTPSNMILKSRIRVSDSMKALLMMKSYLNVKLNIL